MMQSILDFLLNSFFLSTLRILSETKPNKQCTTHPGNNYHNVMIFT